MALRNFALVSQDWLFESRPLLFSNIEVLTQKSYHNFVSMVLRSDRLRPWLSSIRHLSFRLVDPIATEAFILAISKNLSNLRTMRWDTDYQSNYRQQYPLRPEVISAFGRFTRLHHLDVHHCLFASFEDLKKFIVVLPSLSSLVLLKCGWLNSRNSDKSSLVTPPSHIWPAALSKLSLSAYLSKSQERVNNVLMWLSTTPTRRLLRELTIDSCNIIAALRLMPDISLAILNIPMEYGSMVFGTDNSADVVQIPSLLSKLGHIELLRLTMSTREWGGLIRTLQLFKSAPSIRHIRICCDTDPVLINDLYLLDLDNVPSKELETALLVSPGDGKRNALHTLRIVEFAWYLGNHSETLQLQYDNLLSPWAATTFASLSEQCTVEMCVYNDEFVYGPTGLSEHAGGADFPYARPY